MGFLSAGQAQSVQAITRLKNNWFYLSLNNSSVVNRYSPIPDSIQIQNSFRFQNTPWVYLYFHFLLTVPNSFRKKLQIFSSSTQPIDKPYKHKKQTLRSQTECSETSLVEAATF